MRHLKSNRRLTWLTFDFFLLSLQRIALRPPLTPVLPRIAKRLQVHFWSSEVDNVAVAAESQHAQAAAGVRSRPVQTLKAALHPQPLKRSRRRRRAPARASARPELHTCLQGPALMPTRQPPLPALSKLRPTMQARRLTRPCRAAGRTATSPLRSDATPLREQRGAIRRSITRRTPWPPRLLA